MKHHYLYQDRTVDEWEEIPIDHARWVDLIAEDDCYDITDEYREHAGIDLHYIGTGTYGERYVYSDDDGVEHKVVAFEYKSMDDPGE